jgi:lysophospholipase L1-like esterase
MEALGPRLVSALRAAGAREVRTEARRGWSTGRYAASGDLPALAASSDLVILELGGNDSPGATYEQTLDSVLRQVRAPGRSIVWVGPAVATREDVAIRHNRTAELQKAALRNKAIRWLDGRHLTRATDLRGDMVHFTRAGYDRFAQGILESLLTGSTLVPLVLATLALGTLVILLSRS